MNILIVDDDRDKIFQIASVIREKDANINIEDSSHINDARKKLRDNEYDLLILDLSLPTYLDSHAKSDGGYKLLTDILDSGTLRQPYKIMCLTAYKEVLDEYKDLIEENFVTVHEFSYSSSKWRTAIKSEIERQLKPKIIETNRKFKTDFLIVCALKKPELSSILDLDYNWSNPELFEDSVSYTGKIKTPSSDFSVVATHLSRMGSVSSAIHTTKLIHHYIPRYVVMMGICAGDKENTALGDPILISPSWSWESGKWIEDTSGNLKFKQDPHQIFTDSKITTMFDVLSSNQNILFDIYNKYKGNKPRQHPMLKIGPVACGSSVIANKDFYNQIKNQNRKTIGLEMESYGLYCACENSIEPKPKFFCIKSVSDYADTDKNKSYQEYASYVSAETFQAFIMNFHNKI